MPECTASFLEDAKDDFRRATKQSILDLTLDDPEKARAIWRETGAAPARQEPKAPRVAVADRFDGRSPPAREGLDSAERDSRAGDDPAGRRPGFPGGAAQVLRVVRTTQRGQRLTLLAASAVEDVRDGVPVALFPGAPVPPPRPMSLEAFERFHRRYMTETASRVRANLTSRACARAWRSRRRGCAASRCAEDPAARSTRTSRGCIRCPPSRSA